MHLSTSDWLMSDMQVFNNMVRRERQWPGVGGASTSWLIDRMHPDWQVSNGLWSVMAFVRDGLVSISVGEGLWLP